MVRAKQLEHQVAELRDRDPTKWTWRRIAKRLGISHVGAVKAYRRFLLSGGRSLPRDDPGPDVAERLGAVHVEIRISHHVPSTKTRTRNGKDYPREDIHDERLVKTVL